MEGETAAQILLGVATLLLGYLAYRRSKNKDDREERDRKEALRASQEATLSAHVLHRGSGSDVEIVVVNEGPGSAELQSVDVLDYPDFFYGSVQLGRLRKGEKRTLLGSLNQSIPNQVTLRMTWVDDSESEQSRDQILDV